MPRVAQRAVFASLAAQDDNLGDLVIRREMIRQIAQAGAQLHVFVGTMRADYVKAVLEGTAVRRYSTLWEWERSLFANALVGSAGLVFAPGPQSLDGAPRALAREVGNLVNVALLRLRGCPVVKVGRALRGSSPAAIGVERLLHRCSDVYTVRDVASAEALGLDVAVVPDQALALERSARACRRWISLSPRAGREWRRAGFDRLLAEADASGLEVCLVSQTRSDDAYHRRLAGELGIEHVTFGACTMSEQLEAVLGRYEESEFVVSDRLHALLFGLVCGATPVWREPDVGSKLVPTLVAAGWVPESPNSSWETAEVLRWRRDHPGMEETVVAEAQEALHRNARRIVDALSAGAR